MKDTIRVGYIGLGRRGYSVFKHCLAAMADVQIVAICDTDPAKLEAGNQVLKEAGRPAADNITDYRDLLKNATIDAVIIMTGWQARISMAMEAMRAGKYVAIEVGCAYDLSECYDLVRAYEETGMPVMMLENCCYGRREMMALRMVKEGLFGEIVACYGGYLHNLLGTELLGRREDGTTDIAHYRLNDYRYRNCEQYPTHALGPIAKVLNLNRGNRMMTLTSFATKSCGLSAYIQEHLPSDHPYYHTAFRQGDIITTIITCAGGEQIHLTLDTTLPRPYYSRAFSVRGTKGMCEESTGECATFFLEGMAENTFQNEEAFFERYDHPLYTDYLREGSRGQHGGMDWLVVRAFVESVKRGIQTPIDIYDTASWLAIGPLSAMSIARGSVSVDVPDFTKGRWFCREQAPRTKYSLDEIVMEEDVPIVPPSREA